MVSLFDIQCGGYSLGDLGGPTDVSISIPKENFILKNIKVENSSKPIDTKDWKSCSVSISSHTYDVLYVEINNKIFFKPIKPYKSWEFENFFGFKHQCSDFDNNRIVNIIKKGV